jgi:hypothetical protein
MNVACNPSFETILKVTKALGVRLPLRDPAAAVRSGHSDPELTTGNKCHNHNNSKGLCAVGEGGASGPVRDLRRSRG